MTIFPTPQTVGLMVYQVGSTDSHGNPLDTWADPVDAAVISVNPRSGDGSSEPNMPGRDQVIVGLTVMAPPGTVIGARDRVRWQSATFEVEGELGDWNTGPFGWTPGITVNLKRVEG